MVSPLGIGRSFSAECNGETTEETAGKEEGTLERREEGEEGSQGSLRQLSYSPPSYITN